MVALLLAPGCEEDSPSTGPDLATASATFDHRGGSLGVAGVAGVPRITLDLPAGVLAEGETATVELSRSDALAANHGTLDGATFRLGFSVHVEPEELVLKVEGALELGLSLDAAGLELDAEQAAALSSDPAPWVRDHLLFSRVATDGGFQDLERCGASASGGGGDPERILLGYAPFSKSDKYPGEVYLRAPYRVLRESVDNPYIGPKALRDSAARFHLWNILRPAQRFPRNAVGDPIPLKHPHFGDVYFEYYPVSYAGRGKPVRVRYPTGAGEVAKVETCVQDIFARIADRLAEDFPAVAVTHDGRPMPFKIAIWDYTPSETVNATANAVLRRISLPSPWVDPKMYPSADACIDAAGAEERTPSDNRYRVAVLAHEMFHIQQGQAKLGNGDLERLRYAYELDTAARSFDRLGEHTFAPFTYDKTHWWGEATADVFSFELMNSVRPQKKQGVAAYPMNMPAWRTVGAEVIVDAKPWSYARSAFFAYLLDREDKQPADDTLDNLASLLAAIDGRIAAELARPVSERTPPADLDLDAAIFAWAAARDASTAHHRDPMGFVRELTLLRGCHAGNGCPEVPAERSRPYGRVPSKRLDLLGLTMDVDYWSGIAGGESWPAFDDAPFSGAANSAHAGRTRYSGAPTCQFDSVVDAQRTLKNDEGAWAIAGEGDPAQAEPLEVPLPRTLQYHLAGMRIDVVDDIDYQEANRYRWSLRPSEGCRSSLRWEVWRSVPDQEQLTLAYVAEGEGTEPIDFETTRDPAFDTPWTTHILVANDDWEGSDDAPDDTCSFTLEVSLLSCPCTSMPLIDDPDGDPGDKVIACAIDGEGQFVFCDDSGSYNEDLLAPNEYAACWWTFHDVMSGYCGLPAPPPP